MNYIIEFEVAAIMILILLIVMYHVRHNDICENDRAFANLLYLEFICTVFNLISVYTLSMIHQVPEWLNYLINIIYLLAYNVSSIAVFYYIIKVIGSKKLIYTGRKIVYLFLTIMCFFIIPTPWTKYIIYFEDEAYYHGAGMMILYALSVSMLAMIFFVLIVYRKGMDHLQFWVMIAMNVITITSIVIQGFFKYLLIQNFAIAMAYCMLYISLQNPDDYMDKFTGCRNRNSFYRVLENWIEERGKISLVGFTLEDFIHTQTMIGYEETGKLVNRISVFLMKQFGKNQVFHINDGKYIVLLEQGMNSETVIETIKQFFVSPIHFEGGDWSFSPNFFEMKDQRVLFEEIKEILERVFLQLDNQKNQEEILIDDKFIEKIRDEKNLVRQMKKAVLNKSFDVYYQPIYHMQEEKFCSAEALVRFTDENGKMISPDYFIPIAEKNGMILEIGEIVLEKVCSFIKNQRMADQFEYIEINLSTVQCVRENLPEMILSYTKKYQIDSKRLNFEITETAELAREDILMNNMNKLCKEGYSFSLDDYGTGFSTALYLAHMPVNIVKIDKSILWNAMTNERSMSILENMVSMMKQLKKKIVVEGIETQEMVNVLRKLGCDCLQGYFYSRPLAENDLLSFLQKHM